MKELYLTAKQNEEIITTLESALSKKRGAKAPKVLKDWQPTLEKLRAQANQLRGAGQPALYSPAFALVKASLEFAQLSVTLPHDEDRLFKCLEKVDRALNQAEAILSGFKP